MCLVRRALKRIKRKPKQTVSHNSRYKKDDVKTELDQNHGTAVFITHFFLV